jgi:YVTN family beta-propeller protein
MLVGNAIPVDPMPLGIAITPDGTRAYVANNEGHSISVIATNSDQVIATLSDVIKKPEGVAIREDGAIALFTDECDGILVFIDTNPASPSYHQVLQRVRVGDGAEKVAISGRMAEGNLEAYVATETAGGVTVVDIQPGSPTENTVIATIPLGGAPEGVAAARTTQGWRVYVTQELLNSVTVIRPSDHSLETTLAVESYPEGNAASPNGNWVYVTNAGSNSVSFIDTSNNTVAGRVDVGSFPQGVAFSPDGSVAYVANNGDGTVSVIDTATRMVIYVVPARSAAYGVAFTPDGASAYVTNANSDIITACPLGGE